MGVRQFSFYCWKFLGLILVSLCIDPGMSLAARRDINMQEQVFSETLVRQRVSFLMNQIIENSRIRLKDGSYATPMPILPSSDDLQEVKRYGDQAVKVLATYVNSTQGIEQHISLRFLLEFHSDLALTAVRALAEKSAFGGIRQEAITALKGFPPEKVKQIVEHISNNDPDPDVRAHARRIFATFPTSKEVNQK